MTPKVSPPAEPTAAANGEPVFELDPAVLPDYDALVTQDDTPVDNLFVEKQYRLLVEPLYASWSGPGEGRPFVAAADVGLFYAARQPPLVPDALLSVDAAPGADLRAQENHSYFVWEMGKPPDVVIEIVSDSRGGEEGVKQRAYARIRVPYYVIFDPSDLLRGGVLRAYALQHGEYQPLGPGWLPLVGLGLTLWENEFEGHRDRWLRWCDREGRVIPTGAERAEQDRQRAEQERQRADAAKAQADRLAAQLRALGVEPEA
jgi:hypothetical protein